jgi:hypothetical protein
MLVAVAWPPDSQRVTADTAIEVGGRQRPGDPTTSALDLKALRRTTGLTDTAGEMLVLRALRPGRNCESALGLLLEGSEMAGPLARWCVDGQVYVLGDLAAPAEEQPRAAAVVTAGVAGGTVELRTVATDGPDTGLLALRIVREVLNALRATAVSRVIASAAEDEPGRTQLLQRAGFRRCPAQTPACESPEPADDRPSEGRGLIWFEQDL